MRVGRLWVTAAILAILAGSCPVESCTANETFNTCGTPCVDTCENYDEETPCLAVCKEGCECKSGYVRFESRCILLEECPTAESDEGTMGQGSKGSAVSDKGTMGQGNTGSVQNPWTLLATSGVSFAGALVAVNL